MFVANMPQNDMSDNGRPHGQDLSEMSLREKLASLPVEDVLKLKEEGRIEDLEELERLLEGEAEKIIIEEFGLEDYQPPKEFHVPKGKDDPEIQVKEEIRGKGMENGSYASYSDSVFLSTDYTGDYGIVDINGEIENNLLSTSVHELIHSDTHKRIFEVTQLDEEPSSEVLTMDMSSVHAQALTDTVSLVNDLQNQYNLACAELASLSERAKAEISRMASKYKADLSEHKRESMIEEAFEIVEQDREIFHLNYLEMQPEIEAFGWFASMYVEDDLEEREHLERSFEAYEKGEEIKETLKEVVTQYEELTQSGEMNEDEALNYIFTDFQSSLFEEKASQIRRKYN
jgi:hypothetical protein